MIFQNSVSFAQFDNGLLPAITEMVFINKPLKPLSIIRSGAVVSDAARSWGGSAVLGVSPMSDCRGFPHSLLHQEMSDLI
ncbi:hypothetical protein [Moorena sp. SIO3H5]|uniref:hypothetical protein n=1 Tax=Moorena sp. SIO3H5 TaxID=2607834 RepID=UPI0013BAC7B3|nr:hypothetical protein [Moorena sp. SIO3H5]NEO70714.1 hypothetical protein [Moorena sp. SIO3H5]